MQKTDLVKLIKQCKKRDSKAQGLVYDLYVKAMYNTALRILKDSALAEDIMHEAFITAFDRIDSLQEEVTFSKWLKLIVVNKSINQLKKEKRFYSLDREVTRVEEYDDTYIKDSSDKVNLILKAMNSLKENQRVLFSLYYMEGYDYDEIVEITGFTPANCRTIISRAKDGLRKKLGVCLVKKN